MYFCNQTLTDFPKTRNVLLSAPVVFYVFLAISVIVIPSYIVLVKPHYSDDFLTNKNIFYRVPFIEKRLIKKLLRNYLKEQKLSDTEYAVIVEYPDLFSEYFLMTEEYEHRELLTTYANA